MAQGRVPSPIGISKEQCSMANVEDLRDESLVLGKISEM